MNQNSSADNARTKAKLGSLSYVFSWMDNLDMIYKKDWE